MRTPANLCTRLSFGRCIHAVFFSVMILVSGAMGTDVIVDNGDPVTSFTGSWAASNAAGAYAANSLWASDGATPTAESVVTVDNRHAATSRVGKWAASGGKNAYDSDSVYSRTAGHAFSWHFTAPTTGYFEVSMWWTEFSSRSNAVPVEIENADDTAMVTVNQSTDGGRWNVLGSYRYEAGKTYRVTLRTLTDNSTVCADAVRFELIHALAEMVVDNSDSAAEAAGSWTVCGGEHPYGNDSVCARTPGDAFSWFFTPSANGHYETSMWWTALSEGSNAAPVEVEHRLGSSLVTVNQMSNGGRWNVLGTYQFEAKKTYRVTIRTLADESVVCADAVRFVRVSTPPIKADFTVELVDGNPLKVQFRDLSTSDNSIMAWKWDYGNDGHIDSTEQNPSHEFTEPGPHSVALTVESFSGTDTVVKENIISADVIGAASTVYENILDQSSSVMIEEPVAAASTENIYVCVGYGTERMNTQLESMLRNLGARLSSGVWTYSRADKTYRIYNVTSITGMKSAMRTSGAHILYFGHSNYGLGQMFASSAEMTAQKITNFYYVNDDRILNCSTPTVAVSIYAMINYQAYPNWRPIFSDGSSAIAPLRFGDPRGAPPYNYYLTYRVPGDSTYYKIDSPRNDALTRFPGSGRPAWYSSSGAVPNPNNSAHRKYFITNSSASGSVPYHYGTRTILMRGPIEVSPSEMRYSRLFLLSCNSGEYYMQTMGRGVVFYSLDNTSVGPGPGFSLYLQAYLTGKSNAQILAILLRKAKFDYYDFTKRPQDQQ